MSLTSDVIKDLTNKVVAHEANIAELTADNAALREALDSLIPLTDDRYYVPINKARAILQSSHPGADLLKRHAEELASERGKTDEAQALVEEGFRDVEKLVTLIADLRQRVEAERDRNILARAIDPRSETAAAERSTESLIEWAEGTHAQVAALKKERDALRAPLEVFARAVPVVDSIPLSDNEPVYVHRDNGRWLVCFVGAFRAAQAALDPPETKHAPTDPAVLDFLQRATQPVEIRCSGCSQPAGAQHLPRCHRQGLVTSASDYRDTAG